MGTCSTAVCNPTASTTRNRFSTTDGYSYDENGSITQDGAGQRFHYDAENHQKEFFVSTNSGGTPDATYSYDGEGRRVKKVSAAETTISVYDASSELIAEYSTALASTPQVSYLTTDSLGSPRIITNENGLATNRKDFTAFGEEVTSSQRVGGTTGNRYDPPNIRQDYTGYQKDEESGLEFAQARYYNTQHGRYTSVDPLTASATTRNPQTFNRYSYVLNSPYKFTDPLGLATQDPRMVDRSVWRWSVFWSAVYGVGGVYDKQGTAISETSPQQNTSSLATPPPSDVQTYNLITSGPPPAKVDHPEIPGLKTLGPQQNVNGAFYAFFLETNFTSDANVKDYKQLRTAYIMNSRGVAETRSGSSENPSSGQQGVVGQSQLVYDNPGVGLALVQPNSLYRVVFIAGEYNKKTKQVDSNLTFYELDLVIGKNNKVDAARSSVAFISRQAFITTVGAELPKNKDKTLCVECALKR